MRGGMTTSDADGYRASTQIAGLQYHDYARHDEIIGLVMPEAGDRLQIVREPENPHDCHACRVEWRNRFMLGHLPREVASVVAPRLDAGEWLAATVESPGTGGAWSMSALLNGPAVADLHAQRLVRAEAERVNREEQEIDDACDAVWPPPRVLRDDAGEVCLTDVPKPSRAQQQAAYDWERAAGSLCRERRAAAVYAFNLAPAGREAVDVGAAVGERGATYPWWDAVPAGLKTMTQWRKAGRRPKPGATAWAWCEYGSGRRYRRHALIAVADTDPLREVSAEVRAVAAERAFRALCGGAP